MTINGTNDVAIIGGVSTGVVTEDSSVVSGNLQTGGKLTITDADQGQSTFTPQANTPATYGSFTLDAQGNWTYRADNSQTDIQQLGATESLEDRFTAVALDGTTQIITVTINGTNDAPVISTATDANTGSVTENTSLTTGGTLAAIDADSNAVLSWSGSAAGLYGSFAIDAKTGQWTYNLNDNATVDALIKGEKVSEEFTATVTDDQGSIATQKVIVSITGTNDVAIIGGVSTGAVTEDSSVVSGNLQTGGKLTITDADQGQSTFTPQANTPATYGSFTLDAQGNWTYRADNSQTDIQQLGATESLEDRFTAVALDGTTQIITVTINGTNDVAIIGGVSTGVVTEDSSVVSGNLQTGGKLTITDADQGQSTFTPQANTPATYGSFTLDAQGNWTYRADNSQTDIQQLGATESLEDSFTAVSSDGTASQLVTVTINGTNDQASITGNLVGAVTEDTYPNTISGLLVVNDLDAGQSNFTVVTDADLDGTYGAFTFNTSTGEWTYTLDNTKASVQDLNLDEKVTDTLTVKSIDGTSKDVVITITGAGELAPQLDLDSSDDLQAQSTTITFASSYDVGDQISLIVGKGVDEVTYTHTVVSGATSAEDVYDALKEATPTTGGTTTLADSLISKGITWASNASDNTVTLTGSAGAIFDVDSAITNTAAKPWIYTVDFDNEADVK